MSVDVNSPYAPPPAGPRSQEGLGYSRHYAQRIRDMGKTSKESWIKRLWNHMFSKKNGEMPNRKGKTQPANASDRTVKFAPASSSGNPSASRSQPYNGRDSDSDRAVSRSAPGTREKPKFLPSQLADSPYIPQSQRPNYKIEPAKPKTNGSFTNQTVRKKEPPSPFMRKPTHPYLSTHQEAWKPRYTRAPSTIQLEKRAKSTADKAMKEAKIFSCEGPYPVDAYVRFSLRKRGWVEKFGPRANNANRNRDNISTNKLEDAVDEDFEAICVQDIPPPWLEDHGVYAMMSRVVRHYPARFIWGGRGVNSLVLRSETIVNHFPKARYFSSKVCLAGSLKELPWLNSADPLDFFPRCYVLNDEEKDDITEDFRTTACISLLKWVVQMYTDEDGETLYSELQKENTKYEEVTHSDSKTDTTPDASVTKDTNNDSNSEKTPISNETQQPNPPANEKETSAKESQSESEKDKQDESKAQAQTVGVSSGGDDSTETAEGGDGSEVKDGDPSAAAADDDDDEFNMDELQDPADTKPPVSKNDKPKGPWILPEEPIIPSQEENYNTLDRVLPDLKPKKEKKGGVIPMKAAEWALAHCYKYLLFKSHGDIDSRRRGLSVAQWTQLLKWYDDVSSEDAKVTMTESKLKEAQEVLSRMRKVWPQFDIDGMRNIWIVKPGDKSKGIGIEFLNHLDDILKYADNTTTAGTYVVQKYIERPLLIYQCKFDIRQWFLVTDWNPLTVWFYRESYLRICSQEYNYESMHESVHLSNVAIQQFYLNGNRSDKLPDNNFMVSTEFRDYLAEVGAPQAWDKIIYPGMKNAVVNTLLATMDITERRRNGFELYGADFMMSEDYVPWLLEINASPGMAPSSKQKARLCASVIDDTIKVVLDRRESKTCDTGGFELVYRDVFLPPSKAIETKFMLEGQRIRKNDLQRYTQLDQKNAKTAKEKEMKELEKEYEREMKEREEQRRKEQGGNGETESNTETGSGGTEAAEDAGTEESMQKDSEEKAKESGTPKKENKKDRSKDSTSSSSSSSSTAKSKQDGKKRDSKHDLNSKTVAIYQSKPAGSHPKKK